MSGEPKELEQIDTHSVIADGIVAAFLDTLATEEGMGSVATRLRQILLESHSYSESSLRSALFDEGTP